MRSPAAAARIVGRSTSKLPPPQRRTRQFSAYKALIGTGFRDSSHTRSVKAYVLIHASPGRSIKLAAEIRSVPGILAADAITGEYDIIAVGEAPDVHSLGPLVVNHIQKLEGVFKTTTCLLLS